MEIFVGLILFDYPLRTLARGRVCDVRQKIRIKPYELGYLKDSNAAAHSVDTGIR